MKAKKPKTNKDARSQVLEKVEKARTVVQSAQRVSDKTPNKLTIKINPW